VREYRKVKNLTQAQFCDEVKGIIPGIDISLVSKMENNIIAPTRSLQRYLKKQFANPDIKRKGDVWVNISNSSKKSENGRIWDVREVAYAFGVTNETVYSFFKTRGIRLKDIQTGITTEQFDMLIESYKAKSFGSKQKPLNKAEVRDARFYIQQHLDEGQMMIDGEY